MADLKPYEKLFNDCIENKYDDVVKNLASLRAKKPEADPTQPVATLAALYAHSKILKHCLERGAKIDRNLARAMMRTESGYPEMAALVKQHWEKIEDLVETRVLENGDLAPEEMAELNEIEW